MLYTIKLLSKLKVPYLVIFYILGFITLLIGAWLKLEHFTISSLILFLGIIIQVYFIVAVLYKYLFLNKKG
jgi:hypothetical protein